MMMSLMKIFVQAPIQSRSTRRRRRSVAPVGCFQRAVSGQLSVCDWLMLLQGSFRSLPPRWTALARIMIRWLFLLLELLKVGIPSSCFPVCLLHQRSGYWLKMFCFRIWRAVSVIETESDWCQWSWACSGPCRTQKRAAFGSRRGTRKETDWEA